MKIALPVILFCLLTGLSVHAQQTYASQDTAYKQAVESALLSLKKGDCQACLNQYKRAFDLSQKSALSMLRAAACAYQCGRAEQTTSYLQKAIILDWWTCEDVWKNKIDYPELTSLRVSTMAATFQQELDKQKIAVGLNPALQRELEQIFQLDQQPRLHIDTLAKQYGYNSPKIQPVYDAMQQADSVNTRKIVTILDTYGYPGKTLVGDGQSNTAWLVIQHAPLDLQEKYMPMMQQAADQGDLSKANLALLIDRIRIRKGQKQLYGSQVHLGQNGKPHSFEPIEDEANVNKRRLSMDLPPLEEYANQWGIKYVLPKQ